MVNGISSIHDNWLKKDYEGKRSLWIKDKTGNIQLIERSKYSWFKHVGRFSAILEAMSRELKALSSTIIERNEIGTIVSLDKEVDRRYEKYRKGHSKIYLFIFAHCLDKRYKEFKANIHENLKKQLSSLSEEEFEKIIKVLPLSDIDLNDLKPEQLSKVLDEKIKNFDSLNEKEKVVLFNSPQKMSDDQFRLIMNKASLGSFNLAFLTDSKKKIMIESFFNRIDTASQDHLKMALSLTSFMSKEQFGYLLECLKLFPNDIDLSHLTPEQIVVCLEKNKLSIKKLTSEDLNRIGTLLSDNFLKNLSKEQCEALNLDFFSPSQICKIIHNLSVDQKKSLNFSNWTALEVIELWGNSDFSYGLTKEDSKKLMSTTDLNYWSVEDVRKLLLDCQINNITLDCSNWSEDLFNQTCSYLTGYSNFEFANVDLRTWKVSSITLFCMYASLHSLSTAAIVRNLSFLPGDQLAKLNDSQLFSMSLDDLNKEAVVKLFNYASHSAIHFLCSMTLNRNIKKIPHLYKLSDRQITELNFEKLSFEQIMSLKNHTCHYSYKLFDVNLSFYNSIQISTLFDEFHVRYFKVVDRSGRLLGQIPRKYYSTFSFAQCNSIDYSQLNMDQKKAFSKPQRESMKNYNPHIDANTDTPSGGGFTGGNSWSNWGGGGFGGHQGNTTPIYTSAEQLRSAKPNTPQWTAFIANLDETIRLLRSYPGFVSPGRKEHNEIRKLILDKAYDLNPGDLFKEEKFGKRSFPFHADKITTLDQRSQDEAKIIFLLLVAAKELP